MIFKDHFSADSDHYRDFRPGYPPALFEYLAAQSASRQLAWDCATGNGQAAVALAAHFDRVIASDASAEQIAHAMPASRVEYRTFPGEHTDLDDQSVDLVCVAQALHWLDIPDFFDEALRVLKPGGLLAVVSYGLLSIALDIPGDTQAGRQAAINELISRFYADTLKDFWPAERAMIDNRYRNLVFPLPLEPTPNFAMQAEWSLPELLGYLGTWSASKACKRATGRDPVAALAPQLARLWSDPQQRRRVSWPLSLHLGRNSN